MRSIGRIAPWKLPSESGDAEPGVRSSLGRVAVALCALFLTSAFAQSPPSITTTALPDTTVGVSYSGSLEASGGKKPYTWAIVSGSLPAGLTLNANSGGITGTATSPGTSAFTVRVTDANRATDTQSLSIVVNPAISITTASLPPGTVGVPYSQALAATGGSGGYTWSISAGALPAGLSLDSAGTISGTPTDAGTSSFTVQARDAVGATATKQLSIQVGFPPLSITTATLPGGVAGSPYSAQLSAAGGSGSGYAFSVTAGSLPAGLSLSNSGAISGTPSSAGTSNFTVQVRDSAGGSATRQLSIAVSAPALSVTTDSLASGTVGAPYSQTLTASGGTGGYTWSITSGSLPAGLTLSSAGAISGVPTQTGSSTFTVQVKDSASNSATANFTITVGAGVSITTAPVLPSGSVGVQYSQTLAATGGKPPYTWSISAGSLPAGLSFSGGGQISGTPTASGSFGFTAKAVDSAGASATKDFTLTIASALTITTSPTLPGGSVGVAYSAQLAAAGGTAPYTWSVSAGSLPGGLSLNASTGAISGTPSASGSFEFTVTARDSAGNSAQKTLTISIGQGLSFTTPASLPNATAGAPYTFTLGASGGQAPYTWSVTQGSVPPGLGLNGVTGVISGTPTSQGTYNFTLQLRDAAGQTVSRGHSIVVGLPSSGPSVTISGIPAHVAPLQQFPIDVALSAAFPVAMTGQIRVSFSPAGANPMDDPAVQFSTGGRTASFTIPANTTHAAFGSSQFAVQIGSVTGTLTFSVDSMMAGSTPYTPPGGSTLSSQIDAFPPSIRSVSVIRNAGGFQARLVAVSDTRDLAQASVKLHTSGSNPQTAVVTVPLSDVAKSWFQSASSAPYGGQFTLTLPFTFSGADPGLDTVSVTLSNGQGSSQEAPAAY